MLERRVSGLQATLLVIGSMVGSGILVTPAIVAAGVPSPGLAILIWSVGALYALTGALSQAELAGRYPEAGGDYVFLRESYGSLVAFLSGWVSLTVGFAGSLAVLARACAQYLLRGGLADLFSGLPGEEILAFLLIGVPTGINLLGVRKGTLAQSLLTVAKVAGLTGLALAGLAAAGPPAPMATPTLPFWAAFLPVVFTYTGWNDSIYLGSEIRNPGRNLPLSLIAGTLFVALLYVGFNYVYLRVTGGQAAGEDLAAASSLAAAAFGADTSRLVSGLAALLLLGTIAALVVTGPRIAYAMGLDSALPRALARVNTRGAPANALALQALLAAGFVMAGTLEEIISWVGFALVVFSALATSCVFIERRTRTPKGYKIPLYPLPPLLYIGGSLVLACVVSMHDPWHTLGGLAFVAAGLPLFFWSRRANRKDP